MENKKAYLEFRGLEFEVEILGHKKGYGKQRFLISPVAGNGQVWMNEETLIKIK